MPRPFNYTGRELISRRDVLVRLDTRDGPPIQIEVSVDLSKYRFARLANADVILEAYLGTTGERQRFKLNEPWISMVAERFALVDISEPAQLRFNLKVIETDGDGRLLGSCRQIRWVGFEDYIENADGLLPVEPEDIGQLLWKIDFPGEGKPVLLWSEDFWDRRNELAQHPIFRSSALPEMLRSVLTQALDDRAWTNEEGSEGTWFDDWTSWMDNQRDFRGLMDRLEDLDDAPSKERWIDEAVERFAGSTRLRLANRLSDYFSKGTN